MKPFLPFFILLTTFICKGQPIIRIHKNYRVASLQLSPVEYDDWIVRDGFGDYQKRGALTKFVYEKFSDHFDFIIYVLNEELRPKTLPYIGQLFMASNNITGIGYRIFDQTFVYGSSGRLKSIIALTQRNDILSGPSLHELIHNWANFGITTWDWHSRFGALPSYPHWGFSGCGDNSEGFTKKAFKIMWTKIPKNTGQTLS